jgi:hypothetical protein
MHRAGIRIIRYNLNRQNCRAGQGLFNKLYNVCIRLHLVELSRVEVVALLRGGRGIRVATKTSRGDCMSSCYIAYVVNKAKCSKFAGLME